ncbi:Cupin fold metalloprotein, WbuC family [Candidatus Nanopelagicaceae bacterium]
MTIFQNKGIEFASGIFHALNWDTDFSEKNLEELFAEARKSQKNKARFCLHPLASDVMQVTVLAFVSPYSDLVHKHPHRPEVIFPIRGKATHQTFDQDGASVKSVLLDSENPTLLSTAAHRWHSLEVQSTEFAMIEIGTGPFLEDSTIFR